MNPFTFSIATPSFNKGAFIEETIRSDLSQESDFYIDYIVMDGGYTDRRGRVACPCANIRRTWQ
jgi:glycosyltransferase involved in cell wall biosynthesis